MANMDRAGKGWGKRDDMGRVMCEVPEAGDIKERECYPLQRFSMIQSGHGLIETSGCMPERYTDEHTSRS
jgi:hypothetical protein